MIRWFLLYFKIGYESQKYFYAPRRATVVVFFVCFLLFFFFFQKNIGRKINKMARYPIPPPKEAITVYTLGEFFSL